MAKHKLEHEKIISSSLCAGAHSAPEHPIELGLQTVTITFLWPVIRKVTHSVLDRLELEGEVKKCSDPLELMFFV